MDGNRFRIESKRYRVQMEIAGNTAMWTRPDSGDSPVSYPAPTYSAARAIFESILWWPNVRVDPIKVEICQPVQYHSYATNYGRPLRMNKLIQSGGQYQQFATVLTDVCYRLYAEVYATDFYDGSTSPAHAYAERFQERLKRGQSYATLCLGWSEFTPSYAGEFREETQVSQDMPRIEIPSMLRAVFNDGYRSSYRAVYDTDVRIEKGVLHYQSSGGEQDRDQRALPAKQGAERN